MNMAHNWSQLYTFHLGKSMSHDLAALDNAMGR
jgi:hypothetical protein